MENVLGVIRLFVHIELMHVVAVGMHHSQENCGDWKKRERRIQIQTDNRFFFSRVGEKQRSEQLTVIWKIG